MKPDFYEHSWPLEALGEALEVLARKAGLVVPAPAEAATLPAAPGAHEAALLDRWVTALAGQMGFEAEAAEAPYADLEPVLTAAAPALLRLDVDGEVRFLALVGGRRRQLRVVGRDHRIHGLPSAPVRAALAHTLEAPVLAEVDALLQEAGLAAQAKTRDALLKARLGSRPVGGLWLLRLPPSAPFAHQLRQAGLWQRLAGLVGAHTVQYVFWLLSWWLIGQAALQGHLDDGWLVAWVLLLITLVPLRLLVTWWQGYVSIHAGGLLKRRLLFGALRLRLHEIRHQGVGQLLGRVIESGEVESLALSGGFLGGVALIELLLSAAVLALGAGGWLHAAMLILWMVLTALLALRYYRQARSWTAARLTMTHNLVERMVGHRTRLAQQERARWHEAEDQEVERYLDASRTLDRLLVLIQGGLPRGWLLAGFIGLTPAFVLSSPSSGALAVSLGGMILAYRALRRLVVGLVHLAAAAIAWEQVADLFHAATRRDADEAPQQALTAALHRVRPGRGEPVLEGHDLGYRYRERSDPVLHHLNLQIKGGDRLLLEGPSGSGKSTLVALMTGIRRPENGLLLLQGLDRQTLGTAGWRERVVAAPQFHENHILTGTVAFNLLMGRRWPPTEQDLEAAEQVCRELGLGPLLDRMPAGLHQTVGETGWQLSHGECSRLFLARALLQDADLMIFDESFGALDPENVGRAMHTVLKRAPTLMAIAHP